MAELDEKTPVDAKSPEKIQREGGGDSIIREPYEPAVLEHGIRLHPQPTTDPLDPLNWSSFKKHAILGVVMFK